MDGRHRVVDGDAVVEPLRLHQQAADTLETQRLERLPEVAARAGERHVGVDDRGAPEELRVEDTLQRRRPHLVLHRGAAAPVAGPEADARVGLCERAVDVPLVSARVGEEVVDHGVEAVPVAAVPGVRHLGSGERDAALGVALADALADGPVGPGERHFHVGPVVRPRGEAALAPRRFGGERQHGIPVAVAAAPRPVERVERAVLLAEPHAERAERVLTPAEVHRVGVGAERALVAHEVVVHVVDGLRARRGAGEVEEAPLNRRVVEARAPHQEARLPGAAVELLLHQVGERVDVPGLLELGDRLLHGLGRRGTAVVPVDAEPAAGHVELVVHLAAPGEARVHRLLAQQAQAPLGEVVDRRLEREQAVVLLLAPLASGHHDRLVPDLVHDPSLTVHELGRDGHLLAEDVVEAVEERPFPARRGLLDRTHAAEVVAEAHAQGQADQLTRGAGDEAHRVAFAVDARVRAQAGEAGRLRCLETGPAPLERRTRPRVPDDHFHDRAPAGPAWRREVGAGNRQLALAVRQGQRSHCAA